MKLYLLVILLTTIISSCGSDNSAADNQNTQGQNQVNQLPDSEIIRLSEVLNKCSSAWIEKVLDYQHQSPEDFSFYKSLFMGIIARECINKTNIESLEIILTSYELALDQKDVDWISLAKQIQNNM